MLGKSSPLFMRKNIWRAPKGESKSFKQHAFGMDDVYCRIISLD
jgi:hypothetical protein